VPGGDDSVVDGEQDGPWHWPGGLTPQESDLYRQDAVETSASPDVVWNHLIDAVRWPVWWPGLRSVSLRTGPAGRVGPESTLEMRITQCLLQLSVAEYEPRRRLAFFGYSAVMTCYWTWLLGPGDPAAGSGCRVSGALTVNSHAELPVLPHSDGQDRPLTRLRRTMERDRRSRPEAPSAS
jgi:hypothetical protein